MLADWNGLMIAALVNAGVILDEPDWLAMAKRAFDFIARDMTKGDRLGPFLARRQVAFSRPRFRFCRHDPRRAGAQ